MIAVDGTLAHSRMENVSGATCAHARLLRDGGKAPPWWLCMHQGVCAERDLALPTRRHMTVTGHTSSGAKVQEVKEDMAMAMPSCRKQAT